MDNKLVAKSLRETGKAIAEYQKFHETYGYNEGKGKEFISWK